MLDAIISVFLEASPYLLIGLILSVFVQSFLSKEKISSWIGRSDLRSVVIASSAGVPLPLCSCGVIPMAIALRQQGASRGATLSFLISTPETGLDSIMLSFALLNPFIAVFRPAAAFITGIVAGLAENAFDRSKDPAVSPIVQKDPCCRAPIETVSFYSRIKNGFRSTFVELLADITPWLIGGMVLSGMIAYAVPASLIERFLGDGIAPMLLMLIIGLPLYICASASTPIAASLLLKGASPGAVLVFLLAGPATNVTTMLMVYRFLGVRALLIYLSCISVCAVSFGLMLNAFYAQSGLDVRNTIGVMAHGVDAPWQAFSALLLSVFMAYALFNKHFK